LAHAETEQIVKPRFAISDVVVVPDFVGLLGCIKFVLLIVQLHDFTTVASNENSTSNKDQHKLYVVFSGLYFFVILKQHLLKPSVCAVLKVF